jgi:hypothetical protein
MGHFSHVRLESVASYKAVEAQLTDDVIEVYVLADDKAANLNRPLLTVAWNSRPIGNLSLNFDQGQVGRQIACA